MLLKSKISQITINTEEWLQERLSRFTSSENHFLMGEKPFTQGALSYIYRKVGESLSGVAERNSIENEATTHGNVFEPEALRKYQQKFGVQFLVTQKMIIGANEQFSSTPDAIQILSETSDGLGYRVKPIEVKCPLTYAAYVELFLCDTPLDVWRVEKKYYVQVLDQIDNCGALEGELVVYHPSFRTGQMKVIPFRIMEKVGNEYPLKNDLDLLRKRKLMAIEKFNQIKDKFNDTN